MTKLVAFGHPPRHVRPVEDAESRPRTAAKALFTAFPCGTHHTEDHDPHRPGDRDADAEESVAVGTTLGGTIRRPESRRTFAENLALARLGGGERGPRDDDGEDELLHGETHSTYR